MQQAVNITHIADGVTGYHIPAPRFKTTRITVQLLTPMDIKTVSRNAMLPYTLARACRSYPDLRSLNSKLASLYGASLYGSAAKIGDVQALRLTVSFINDRYAIDGSRITEECARLLLGMIFSPLLNGARFDAGLFDGEKRLFLEKIDGEVNEKRRYAISRTEGIMASDEPFGISKYGPRAMAQGLTAGELYLAWEELLKTAVISVNTVGDCDSETVYSLLKKALAGIERAPVGIGGQTLCGGSGGKSVTERMAVTQSKLVMGFISDITKTSDMYIPATVFCDLYGGSPTSKLFQNVREKLSLCYYCAARYNRSKGIMLVDSGVSEDNAEKAKSEILAQLERVKAGGVTDEELAASKISLIDTARSVLDSQSSLDAWYCDRALDAEPMSPAQFADRISAVSKEQAASAANHFTFDTAYLLAPEEGETYE